MHISRRHWWKFVSPYNEVLGDDFDLVRVSVVDPAHSLKNFMQDLFGFLGNKHPKRLNPEDKEYQETLGRKFLPFRKCGRVSLPPWTCSKKRRVIIDKLLLGTPQNVEGGDWTMTTPQEWGRPTAVLGTSTKQGNAKISENLWFYSSYGLYVISITDIHPKIKKAMINAVKNLSALLRKTVQDKKVTTLGIAGSLAQLEVLLPTFFCTSSIHYLLHYPAKFGDHGAFWAVMYSHDMCICTLFDAMLVIITPNSL